MWDASCKWYLGQFLLLGCRVSTHGLPHFISWSSLVNSSRYSCRPCSTIADCGEGEYARKCSANADALCAKCTNDVDCGKGMYWAMCSETADGMKFCTRFLRTLFAAMHTM